MKKHRANPQTIRPYGRLKLIGAGLVLALVGFLRMAKGVQVVTHGTGQPRVSQVRECTDKPYHWPLLI